MNEHQTQVIRQCAHGSLAGKLTFPEIVGQLAQIGIERYHADYSRQEITYYSRMVIQSSSPRLILRTKLRPSFQLPPLLMLFAKVSVTNTPIWTSFRRQCQPGASGISFRSLAAESSTSDAPANRMSNTFRQVRPQHKCHLLQ